MNLHAMLERFVTAKTAAGLSPRTVAWYEDQIGICLRWLHTHNVALSPQSVELYLSAQRMSGLAPATIAARYRALRIWLNWLEKRNLIKENPMRYTERPRAPIKRVAYVTAEEYDALYTSAREDNWPDARDRAVLLLLYWSGLRVGELAALTTDAIDSDSRLVLIRGGKGGKDRIVPFHPDLPADLAAYLRSRPHWDGPELWLSNDGYNGARGPLSVEGIRQMLRRRCKRIGIRHLHPHAFRHGYAMRLLNAGMSISAVAAAMGHYSVTITEQTYARWLPAALRREYDDALSRA